MSTLLRDKAAKKAKARAQAEAGTISNMDSQVGAGMDGNESRSVVSSPKSRTGQSDVAAAIRGEPKPNAD